MVSRPACYLKPSTVAGYRYLIGNLEELSGDRDPESISQCRFLLVSIIQLYHRAWMQNPFFFLDILKGKFLGSSVNMNRVINPSVGPGPAIAGTRWVGFFSC